MKPHTPSEWAWTAYLSVMAVLSLLMIATQVARSPGPVQEVSLPAITVEREDPYPCLNDPAVRAACERQGCECRGDR